MFVWNAKRLESECGDCMARGKQNVNVIVFAECPVVHPNGLARSDDCLRVLCTGIFILFIVFMQINHCCNSCDSHDSSWKLNV